MISGSMFESESIKTYDFGVNVREESEIFSF